MSDHVVLAAMFLFTLAVLLVAVILPLAKLGAGGW